MEGGSLGCGEERLGPVPETQVTLTSSLHSACSAARLPAKNGISGSFWRTCMRWGL